MHKSHESCLILARIPDMPLSHFVFHFKWSPTPNNSLWITFYQFQVLNLSLFLFYFILLGDVHFFHEMLFLCFNCMQLYVPLMYCWSHLIDWRSSSSRESSWQGATELLLDVASQGEASGYEVPCLIVAAKDDLDPYLTEIQDSTRVHTNALKCESPSLLLMF